MGNLKSCFKGNPATNIINSKPKAEDPGEKKFNALFDQIETATKDQREFVCFKYTWVKKVDDVIYGAQKICIDISRIRCKLRSAYQDLIRKTEIWHIPGSHSAHAIMALIYAMAAQTKGAGTEEFITFGGKFPWFKVGKDSATVNIGKDSAILAKYFEALEEANLRIPALVEKCKDFGKKSGTLLKEAEREIKELDTITAGKATRNIGHNAKMLKRAVNLSKATAKMIKKLSDELGEAYQMMKEEHSKLPENGKLLADEAITIPFECYKRVGPKVWLIIYKSSVFIFLS
jgi:hypothetical protein